jgi:hypothetical protein
MIYIEYELIDVLLLVHDFRAKLGNRATSIFKYLEIGTLVKTLITA